MRTVGRMAVVGAAALVLALLAAPGASAQASVSCLNLATFETVEPTILGTDGRDVLRDEDVRRDLIARGRRQASRFSWERTARQVLEIYLEAAAER